MPLIALLVLLTQPYTVNIPLVLQGDAWGSAGIAGYMTGQDIPASWFYHWTPCWGGVDDDRCIHHWKGDAWDVVWRKEPYVSQAIADCPGGYVMIGNEWAWAQYPMSWQVTTFQWFAQIRDRVNPSCGLVCCGALATVPGDPTLRTSWLTEFRAAYLEQYGQPPPLAGIHFHSYKWADQRADFVENTLAYIDQIRYVYPGAEIWLTETGALESRALALEALSEIPQIARQVDRWAFYTSYDAGYPCSLWRTEQGDRLTKLGRRYNDLLAGY